MQLKIGVLLPRSEMFPTLAMDFLNGLKLVINSGMPQEIDPVLLVEGIGNAVDESLLKTAEKLILQEDVAVTLAFCGNNQLIEFVSIFNNYKKPLIHIDLGGSVLKDDEQSPYVLHHTLNIWQSAYASGRYAAQNFGKKGVVISSIYDGGYHMAATFNEGFESEGGKVDHFYVAPMDYKSESFETMVEGIKDASPEVIFAIFSYKEGQKVFDVIARSDFNGKIPVLTIPLMTDESFNKRDHQVENVLSVANWSFDEENENMQEFIENYSNAYENNPNIIALMGYEIGLTLLHCVSSDGKVPSKLEEALKNKKINSPRGTLVYNERNESEIDSFKVRKFEYNKTVYHNNVIDSLDASFSATLYETFKDLPNVGWQNPYICT
ncbi:MAG: ABC transporter substrate-binding protein [Bacteroidia bacterium]|nr:ABC transporter substrate-binding protein [Bacteroidia bacterium]NNF29885.1 ABC transporter substrate-binding protein [Flavobacteriaceae bacterium]NNK54180.1 ABC transporter substrate-binding protein [Flavobacteriaceae bacterium]